MKSLTYRIFGKPCNLEDFMDLVKSKPMKTGSTEIRITQGQYAAEGSLNFKVEVTAIQKYRESGFISSAPLGNTVLYAEAIPADSSERRLALLASKGQKIAQESRERLKKEGIEATLYDKGRKID